MKRKPVGEKLVAYCMDWHVSGSDGFRALVVDPLSDSAEFELRGWDGADLGDQVPGGPTIFCQLPPPKALLGRTGARLVWIPMWDQAHAFPQEWWNSLPRDLRVIALSPGVERRARAAGLPTLRLRYFADPATLKPVPWNGEHIAFHWNRTGLLSPREIAGLCEALSVTKLLFRDQLDPRVPRRRHYKLPSRLGRTEVVPVRASSREEFLTVIENANIFVAPRALEGVGISIMEALARGCCVVGHNAPAMNEYIRDGENGLLFELRRPTHRQWLLRGRWLPQLFAKDEPWRRSRGLNLAELGRRARLEHQAGHRAWRATLPRYESFVFDW